MFYLFAVLCMLSYEGEVCKTYTYQEPFQTKAACIKHAKGAKQDFIASGNVLIRIKEMRCEKPVAEDGM